MSVPSFIFGGDTGETPASIKRKREIANMLMGKGGAPKNVGQGLQALGDGLVAGVLNRRALAGEKSGRASAQKAMAPIFSAFTPQEEQVASQPAYTGPNAPIDVPGSAKGTDPIDVPGSAYSSANGGVAGGIVSTANALGVDPVDLGTAISYETAGTFDPKKRGPTTQWGQHRGLIQFGQPQAKKYGVDFKNPVSSQLGPDGAVAKYLRDTGVKPGMGMLDIYSAINAGGVGRYNRSDANNGGAPGTVRDKVETQMAGHRRKAQALLSSYAPKTGPQAESTLPTFNPKSTIQASDTLAQGDDVQVASLDPAAGVEQAFAQQETQLPQSTQNNGIQTGRLSPVPPSPERIVGQDITPQQIAQADLSGLAPGAGVPDTRPQTQQPQQQQGGPTLPMLLQALQNPWLNDGQRAVVQSLVQQQQQANDPMRQLQMRNIESQINTRAAKAGQEDAPSYSKTPVYGTDQNGNTVLGTVGDDGSFKEIDTGGFNVASGFEKIDTGTEVILRDKKSGQIVNATPKQNFEAEHDKSRGKAAGKAEGEAGEAFESLRSKMPGLQKVVSELDVLADQATYTYGGQAVDWLSRQTGFGATDGGLARTKYIATVDNQVLPLLRDTFGAAFTVKEGESLRATLGDPDKAPSEKQSVLKAFIQQKQRDLDALARRTGQTTRQLDDENDPLGIRN